VLRIAKDIGLKTRVVKMDWQKLAGLGEGYPVIALLSNGQAVIVSGFKSGNDKDDPKASEWEIVLVDPTSNKRDFLFLKQEQFEESWEGEILLLKRFYKLSDTKQPFGLRWFIPEVIRQKKSFTDIAIAAIFIHFIALITPIFFQVIIDKVLAHQSYSTLHVLGTGIVIALLFDAALDWLRNFLLLNATSKIDVRVATRTFSHLLSLPVSFFEKATAGVLTKHMQQTSSIREFLTGSLFMSILDASALFMFIPALIFYSGYLSMIVIGMSLLLALIILALIPTFRRRLHDLYESEGDRQAMLVESIQGMQTIKALTLEPTQRKAWDEKAAQAVSMQYRVGKISISARTLSQFIEKIMSVVIIWVGAQLVFSGELTVGTLVAFNMLAGRVSGPLVQLVGLVHQYQETSLSVRMLGNIMNQPSEGGTGFGGLRPSLSGEISFEKVNFRYQQNLPLALNNIEFKIPAGATVGIVGRSGSGKTTLTHLLQGMYSPQSGLIRFDGIDMREIDLAYLRCQTSVVLQENFLFRGTVRDNIRMTRNQASMEEIIHAAELAGATEFIENLPQGFDTLLEENASNLSGGQKQRLAIARALLTQPSILILDEATSALDPESEAIVQKNLNKISSGRTVLIVSHRLMMLVNADFIIVLDHGKVVAKAPHSELLNNCEIYRTLWEQQMNTERRLK
jgi:ATP-binding cassette subfamily B protein